MSIAIRELTPADRMLWARLRSALWPEETQAAHAAWIDVYLRDGDAWAFVAETPDGSPIGFAEVSLRRYANGCEGSPVPFLEGIWVEPSWRRRGIAACLIVRLEEFLIGRGFRELGSDALLENRISHAAHASWGFSETERVVYFRKILER